MQNVPDIQERWGDELCFDRYRRILCDLFPRLLEFPRERELERNFLLAVLRRTLSLERAFLSAVGDNNGQMALTLVRLNLDSLARTYALYWADETAGMGAEAFAKKVWSGVAIRDIRLSRKGKKAARATDAWLIDQIKPLATWIPDVYKATSGAIHFSDFHMKQMLQQTTSKGVRQDGVLVVELAFGPTDTGVGPQHYEEVRQAFVHVTALLATCIDHRCPDSAIGTA
ncbi:hypothetical protein [Stenotrophomonas maltophilia]|uniref:hypothetical protein n=1 Tax=Stenotrophomonas maltophilia TaxID=40324 RepID=UPI0021C9EF21|nr:hypothetical protein [Stenotrophomonas maltophilia]MCU1145496.1 hypothetical protein [Stenotrophomonas maltophilia]